MISWNIDFFLPRSGRAHWLRWSLRGIALVGAACMQRLDLQQRLDRLRQYLQVTVQRRGHRIEPVHRAHEVGHRFGRCDVLDADRDDGRARMDGALHLAADLPGIVGVRGEDQDHDAALVDRLDDGGAPFVARPDVARCHPAADARLLERRAGCVSGRLVDVRMADEDFKGRRSARSDRQPVLTSRRWRRLGWRQSLTSPNNETVSMPWSPRNVPGRCGPRRDTGHKKARSAGCWPGPQLSADAHTIAGAAMGHA